MKTLTLRKLPPHLISAIRRRAKERGISMAQAAISLLEDALTAEQDTGPRYHDLDNLAGSWTREEAASFDGVLREQRWIDPNLWH